MHNPSMYEVVRDIHFGARKTVSLEEYEKMRQATRKLSFSERLEIVRQSEKGNKLFPLQCHAKSRMIGGVEILCLTSEQVQGLIIEKPYLLDSYPKLCTIEEDPIQEIVF